MPGEVFEKAGTNIEIGQPITELSEIDFGHRKDTFNSEMEKISKNVKDINKRLADTKSKWSVGPEFVEQLAAGHDILDANELNLAAETAEKELDALGDEFQAKMAAANKEFKGDTSTKAIEISDALYELNNRLDTFLTERLGTIIHEADLADADRDAFYARLYPKNKPKDKPKFGEEAVAAMGKHFRDANIQ